MYIGQTSTSIKKRWRHHCTKGNLLYSAIKKYGRDSFNISVLAETDKKESLDITTKLGSQQDTSGKLLYFTLLKRDSFMWNIYKYRMEKLYGQDWCTKVFAIYFHTEPSEHPLIYLSERYHG